MGEVRGEMKPWESKFKEKKCLAWGRGVEQPQSWQSLANASGFGCAMVKEEGEDARNRQLDLGAADFPDALKVSDLILFSLRLRKSWKSCFKNVHLEKQ